MEGLGGMLPFQMVKCPGHEVELRVPERTESQREGAKAHLLRPPKGEGNAAPEEDQRLQTPPIILNILDIIKDHARLFTVCITSLTWHCSRRVVLYPRALAVLTSCWYCIIVLSA